MKQCITPLASRFTEVIAYLIYYTIKKTDLIIYIYTDYLVITLETSINHSNDRAIHIFTKLFHFGKSVGNTGSTMNSKLTNEVESVMKMRAPTEIYKNF